MATLYGLNAADVARLKSLLDWYDLGETGRPLKDSPTRGGPPDRILVGALESSVAATTALLGKPKVGTLSVYTFTSTGTTDSGRDVKCYNFAPQAATTDRWTVVERCNMTGQWIITTQFCS